MALPPLYQGGQEPARSMPLPQRDASAYGGGIGAGLSELGRAGVGAALDHEQTQERVAQIRYQTEAEQQTADFGVRAAEARQRIDTVKADLRSRLPSGGVGYDTQLGAAIDAEEKGLFAGLTNSEAQRRAAGVWASYAGGERADAHAIVLTAAAKKQSDDLGTQLDLGMNRVTGADDWQAVSHEIEGVNATIDAWAAPEDTRAQAKREAQGKLAASFVQGQADRNPAGALRLIDGGTLDGILDPEARKALRQHAEVQQRSLESQARAADAQAKTIEGKAIAGDEAVLDAGRGTSQQWAQIAARKAAIGDEAGAVRARAKGVELDAAEAYRGATPGERTARITALGAQPTLTAAEGAELAGLKGQASYVDGLPAIQRAAYATGRSAAPINWHDPASIARRTAEVDAATQRFGGAPDYLLPEEEKPLRELAQGTPDQKMAAIATVRMAGRYAGQVLDVVAGGDAGFRAAAQLSGMDRDGQAMRDALAGPDALKAHKGILTPEKDPAGKAGATHEQIFNAALGASIGQLAPAAQRDILFNATNIYATRAGRQGWSMLHPGEFLRSINTALGGVETPQGWAGGLGRRNGAAVVLPRGMTQAEFDRRLSRATGPAWGAAALSGPAMAGDRPMMSGEARGLVPVKMRDGVYALRQGNSLIVSKAGGPFLFDVRKLP